MTNQKGISMITLVITIIVMIILASIVYVVGNDGRETAEHAKYENEKKLIQEAMQSRYATYMRNPNAGSLEGTILENTLTEIVTQLEEMERNTLDSNEVRDEITSFLDKNSLHPECSRIINYNDMLSLGITNVTSTTNYSYIANYYTLDVIGPIK